MQKIKFWPKLSFFLIAAVQSSPFPFMDLTFDGGRWRQVSRESFNFASPLTLILCETSHRTMKNWIFYNLKYKKCQNLIIDIGALKSIGGPAKLESVTPNLVLIIKTSLFFSWGEYLYFLYLYKISPKNQLSGKAAPLW